MKAATASWSIFLPLILAMSAMTSTHSSTLPLEASHRTDSCTKLTLDFRKKESVKKIIKKNILCAPHGSWLLTHQGTKRTTTVCR